MVIIPFQAFPVQLARDQNPVLPSSDTCTLALDPATGEYLAFHKFSYAVPGR